jgi:hypothetical protein
LKLNLSGTHDQISAVVKTVAVLLSWGVFSDVRRGMEEMGYIRNGGQRSDCVEHRTAVLRVGETNEQMSLKGPDKTERPNQSRCLLADFLYDPSSVLITLKTKTIYSFGMSERFSTTILRKKSKGNPETLWNAVKA